MALDPDTSGHPPRGPAARDRLFGDIELRDRLDKAIDRLPPNDRLIITAHYLDGVRYEELTDALDMPLGTLETHLHGAKRQLRRMRETDLK